MIDLIDPVEIVITCKGAKLAILWLLLATRKPQTQEWLERHSGYTDKTVSQAIAFLAETQRITKTIYGWVISEGFQLSLPLPIDELSRRNSDSTTTTAINNSVLTINKAVEEERVGKFPTPDDRTHAIENLTALKQWGVGINDTTLALATHPDITPTLINDNARRLHKQKRFSTGLLITTLRCGDQPTPQNILPSEARDPARYADWEKL